MLMIYSDHQENQKNSLLIFRQKRMRTNILKKKIFINFHPQALQDYVEHGLTAVKQGLELKIPEKEVAIFQYLLDN